MAYITWKDKLYSIGVPAIDSQHKKLIEMINRLYEAMESGKSDDAVREVLIRLAEYVNEHFSTEEEFMKKINYLEYNRHRGMHEELTGRVRNILMQLKSDKAPSVHELLAFLKQWLVDHVQNEDKKIGKALEAARLSMQK